MRRFEGRVAVVSGAAQGMGKAVATRLGAEGATIVAVDINGAGYKFARNLVDVLVLGNDLGNGRFAQFVMQAVRAKNQYIAGLQAQRGCVRRDKHLRP